VLNTLGMASAVAFEPHAVDEQGIVAAAEVC
jgi:hypothetical protein